MGRFVKNTGWLLGASMSVLALSGAAQAQSTTAPSPAPVAEEQGATTSNDIIVTANKREERLLDVALSISAVSGAELTEKRLIDIQDLAQRVPGLSFSRGTSGGIPGGQRVILRGLNTGGNGTVAITLDDISLTASAPSSANGDAAADFDPYDLERVEALKGPQGTLYGASSLGGLIKYVTKAPDLTRLGGGFDFGGFDIRRGEVGAFGKAYVNAPIATDIAAIRASGYYEYTPGWIDNPLIGKKGTNFVRRYGARATLLVKPTPELTIRGTALFQERQSNSYDSIEVRGYLDEANRFEPLNGYSRNAYFDEPSLVRSQVYGANIQYDFGRVLLQSITSFNRTQYNVTSDAPLYVPLSEFFLGRPNTGVFNTADNDVRKFTQELRIISDGSAAASGSGLEYQAGLFYTRERTRQGTDYRTRDATTGAYVVTPAAEAVTPPGTPLVGLGQLRTKYREYAGYLDLTYHFSPAFDVELGGRLFRNEQSYTQETGGVLFAPPEFQTIGTGKSSETRATFAVAPRFHVTPDLIVYGRVASGYRPGGPNLAVPAPSDPSDTPGTPPISFGADTTVNYEIGVKGSVARNLLSFAVTGFYIDWTDIQVQQFYQRGGPTGVGYPIGVNAGKAVSKGVEWDVSLRPVTGLTLGVLGAYTEATLSDDVAEIGGAAGSQLPFVPKWTTTVTADYVAPITDDISFKIGGAYARVGDRRTGYGFNPTRSYLPIPGYETWNADIGLTFGGYYVQIYGKNLTDERGITTYDRGRVVAGVPLPGTTGLIRPREIGLRLSGSF